MENTNLYFHSWFCPLNSSLICCLLLVPTWLAYCRITPRTCTESLRSFRPSPESFIFVHWESLHFYHAWEPWCKCCLFIDPEYVLLLTGAKIFLGLSLEKPGVFFQYLKPFLIVTNIKENVGDGPCISACYLVGMAHSLPAKDLRHSFQLCVRNVTSDMTGVLKGIYVSSTQLQCHCWVEDCRGPPFCLLPS